MKQLFGAKSAATGVAVAEEMMAEPISLSVGGRSHWGVAVFDDEATQDRDDLQISNDALLVFSGSTVLDSGVEVAVRIEIEGEENTDQGDAKFADFSGSFGTIRIGNEDTAAKKMATVAPYATYFYGINDAYWSFSYSSAFEGSSQTWTDTYANAGAGASASLLYFSPVINGFQFGVSYAPEAGKEAPSGTAPVDDGNDVMSIGLV
ncbi:MAG: porin [Alphaproteobacteria bacterium]|nr:porin [Alphaproteobacteria bacterium]